LDLPVKVVIKGRSTQTLEKEQKPNYGEMGYRIVKHLTMERVRQSLETRNGLYRSMNIPILDRKVVFTVAVNFQRVGLVWIE
jgi:hypothetical protein